ncbi:MAG: hypothetical protein M9934_11895 [Thermomicrobiales bacterium]|nr:hypothetical protein [Thermomicrobiales bacterium]
MTDDNTKVGGNGRLNPVNDDSDLFTPPKGAVLIGVGKAGVDATLGVKLIPVGSSSTVSSGHSSFDTVSINLNPPLYLTARDRREAAIQKKYEESGADIMLGEAVEEKVGAYRFYRRAAIVYNRRKERAYLVRDAIFDKWKALGGLEWGIPSSDEDYVGDGRGRVCQFDDGDERMSIYWILNLGAHEVHGAIRRCWREYGSHSSWLGYPITDEEDFPEGGKVSQFEHGGIYWWPDTGAVPLGDVAVQYTGFHCFGETDWDGGSSSDEPYFVLTPAGANGTTNHRTRIYDDVDAGEQRVDPFEIYRGKPFGVSVGVVTMEHDNGDADVVRNIIANLSNGVYSLASAGAGANPVNGAWTADLLEYWLTRFIPALGQLLDSAIDWGDDVIGGYVLMLNARDMVLLAAQASPGTYGAIPYKLETGLMSGHGASYKVFFNVVEA